MLAVLFQLKAELENARLELKRQSGGAKANGTPTTAVAKQTLGLAEPGSTVTLRGTSSNDRSTEDTKYSTVTALQGDSRTPAKKRGNGGACCAKPSSAGR